MWGDAAGKIEDIHAMMATGHRSIRIERHTFILWGLAGALLVVVVNAFFTPENFSVHWQRILFSNLFIAAVLVSVAVLDFRLTRRERENRDEILSFVQLQLTKLWWLFITLIVLINIGMNFYGGGYLFYSILLALLGMALYAQGLFSQQMLSWIGVCLILLGLGSIALGITLENQKWLTVSVLGLGFSLLAWWLDFPGIHAGRLSRALLSLAWLLLVVVPVAAADRLSREKGLDTLPIVSLENWQNKNLDTGTTGRQIVRIPAGTSIPLNIEVSSDIVKRKTTGILRLELGEDVDIVVVDTQAEATARVSGNPWKNLHNKPYTITRFKLNSSLDQNSGPELTLSLDVATRGWIRVFTGKYHGYAIGTHS